MAHHCDRYSPACFITIRTARWRTSVGQFGCFGIALRFVIAHLSQELKPPTNPGRFKQLGYTVLPFGHPKHAIEALGDAGRVDLVMTDVVLPEMNGRELSRVVTAKYPEVQCLFMSGYMAGEIAPHSAPDERLHFIAKPFTIGALAVKLRQILGASSSRG